MVSYTATEVLEYLVQNRPQLAKAAERKIDYSDIPELTAEQMRDAKRVRLGRPLLGFEPRKMISFKIDPILLDKLKRKAKAEGIGYQTFLHGILEDYFRKRAA